jgi:altronate dehydratase
MGHKFALKDMDEGEAMIKYGEPIGQSTVKISRGEHPKG